MKNITKGYWKINKHSKTCVEVDNRSICSTGGYQSNVDSVRVYEENEANAKMIAVAGNLAQKYNIEAFEHLYQALSHAVIDLPTGSVKNMATEALKKAIKI